MPAESKISFIFPEDLEHVLNADQVTVLQTMANAFEQRGKIAEGSISDLILHMHQSDLLPANRCSQAIKDLKDEGFFTVKKDRYKLTPKFTQLIIQES